jgi:hypothetical protein
MCMREWEKTEKDKREVARKIWEGWIKWNKKIKCKEGCHVVERRNFHSFFPTLCNPTTSTCPPF